MTSKRGPPAHIFGDFEVKEHVSDKYLCQILHGGGLEVTAKERACRIKGAAVGIKCIIEEFQMQALGVLRTTWELWERALILSLGTWFSSFEHTVNLCNDVMNFFLRNHV